MPNDALGATGFELTNLEEKVDEKVKEDLTKENLLSQY